MAHVVVVGAGAIGSHVLPHLARSPHVSRVTVIDRDRYDATNLPGQDIAARDVGRPKATVQARRLRRINPQLHVTALRAAVEDVPLGCLRATAVLGCLDSRAARMTVNQAAWRLGVPWIDAGIDAGGSLARVRTFVPAADAPCLECAWDQPDYAALEQAYPCAPAQPAATAAPSMIGALAASLQAVELHELLANDATAPVRREVLLDARHQRHYVTEYRRNPSCRMPDHDGWRIAPLGGHCTDTTLGEVLTVGSTLRGAGSGLSFAVAGQSLVTLLHCPACVTTSPTLQLDRHVRESHPRCPECGGHLSRMGAGLRDMVAAESVPEVVHDRMLAGLGLRPHDVITLRTPELDVHFELE